MWQNRLNEMYSTPGESGAFSSTNKLYDLLKKEGYTMKRSDVQNWLKKQYTYSIHRHRVLTFPRNPIIANYPDHNWQADILFLPDLTTFNNRKPCMLLCIDVVSRYAWVEPMSNKSGIQTAQAFQKILSRSAERCPEKLQTDKGKEFYNKHFEAVMKQHGIIHYSTESDKKAAIAERCIKEIKKLIYRFLSTYQTNRYIDDLQNIVQTYNSTVHGSIGMPPQDVNDSTLAQVLKNLYGHLWEKDATSKPKYQIGDFVRISIAPHHFQKGYKGFWTTEIFTIDGIKRNHPKIMYRLKDANDEVIKGLFYEEEIQHAHLRSQRFTEINKVLRKKTIKGKQWMLVNWKGEPETLKRWIPADSLQKIREREV